MAKVDFSILFDLVEDDTRDVKDIALVSDVANISQQIQNVVFSQKTERPFNPKIGLNFDVTSLNTVQPFFRALFKSRIKSSVGYSIPNITDIKVSLNTSQIKINYKYITKPEPIFGELTLNITTP